MTDVEWLHAWEGGSMTSARVSHAAAAAVLADRDPVIARLLAETGPPQLRPFPDPPFAALVRAIVYQQLAGAAAAAIHGRLVAALAGNVTPETLSALSDEAFRAAGMSRNKILSLRDLAAKTLDGTVVLTPRRLARQSDEEIVARLSAVRGIGRWTAEVFLLFQLRRLDIWPVGDLGVRRGYGPGTSRRPPPSSWSRWAIRSARIARWPRGTAGARLNSTVAPQTAHLPNDHRRSLTRGHGHRRLRPMRRAHRPLIELDITS
jgi:DNA-3-methyladenine glycosylase II